MKRGTERFLYYIGALILVGVAGFIGNFTLGDYQKGLSILITIAITYIALLMK